MAAFAIANWSRLAIGGAISTGNKSTRSLYGYWSNETLATIEGTGYFNDLINDLAVGDVVIAVADLDGTPTMRIYYVSSVTTNVALSQQTNQVAGDQAAVADLAGTLTGTADGTLVDVAAAAGACAGAGSPSATNVDTAIATAVAPIVTGINLQNKELMTKINAILAMLRTSGLLTA